MMDRRELLHRASMLLGGAITASAASGVLAGCVAMPEQTASSGAGFLTSEETATVTAMADLIIPRTDTPGAIDVGVPAFIDRMLAGYYTDKQRDIIRAGLAETTRVSSARHNRTFAALLPDQQISMMRQYDQQAYADRGQDPDPHFFRLIKELTIIGFCSSEAGAKSTMNYVQTPGPFRGDVPLSEVGKASAL